MSTTVRTMPLLSEAETRSADVVRDTERIEAWLVDYLARLLDLAPDAISVLDSFQEFGLDSAAAVGLTGDLGRWLGRKLEPTMAYDYPTIGSLSAHLAADFETAPVPLMRRI